MLAVERIARSQQHLVFAGLHVERQEIGRWATRRLRRDEAVEAARLNLALLQKPGAVIAEIEVDAECILNSVIEDAIELTQRGEARIDVNMQQAFAVAVGQAGRNNDQLASAVLAGLLDGGNGVGIGLVKHLDEVAGESGQPREGMIAPAPADMV